MASIKLNLDEISSIEEVDNTDSSNTSVYINFKNNHSVIVDSTMTIIIKEPHLLIEL